MTVTLMTRANKGLGYETARQLIMQGHTICIGARRPQPWGAGRCRAGCPVSAAGRDRRLPVELALLGFAERARLAYAGRGCLGELLRVGRRATGGPLRERRVGRHSTVDRAASETGNGGRKTFLNTATRPPGYRDRTCSSLAAMIRRGRMPFTGW